MHRRRASLVFFVVLVALMLTTVTLGAVQRQRSLSDTVNAAIAGQRFSIPEFEFQTVFNKWLGEVGAFVSGRRDAGTEADQIVERYFSLRARVSALEANDPASPELADLRREQAKLENRAERVLEARVADALRRAGFARPLPLFDDQRLLWPPVDVELARPPRLLAVSPRDEIRLVRDILLDSSLSPAEVARIEAEIEADGRWSALVDTIGGVAAYPAIVRDTRSYASSVATIAHEWTHHYLYFYPLGRAFFDSSDLRTINETVADMVGDEIGRAVVQAHPTIQAQVAPPAGLSASDELLFQLRLDVDRLLAEGRVAAAESLMEEVRLELAVMGRPFRRINQAFFAFKGVYATTPASSSPIGPMLQELRARSDSLIDFLALVRGVQSLAGLEALVADG